MNKIYRFMANTMAIMILLLGACTPDKIEMEVPCVTPDELVEGIAYSITPDSENPNIVYLESLMDSRYTPLWTHPQGRSQKSKVTLKIPFEGEYEVTFGVMTRGGAVYGAPSSFDVTTFYAGFVDDEMWSLLSGGVDNEKTWYLDLDAESTCRSFVGPLYFYGVDDWWGNVSDDGTALGEDSWNWAADYAGNTWVMPAGDYGSMTFSLKGGANVTVNHLMIPSRGTENGTYMLDTENKTLVLTDAAILHDEARDNQALGGWGSALRILSLTENTMQIGVMRDPATSGEGPAQLSYNFISKDYYDNWTPDEVAEPEPTLPDGWMEDVSQVVSSSIKWVLSPETPFNWAGLDGTLLNSWALITDYPDWTGVTAVTPDSYANFSLTLNSLDASVVYTDLSGLESTGTYTLDENGYYTFTGVTPNFAITPSFNFAASAENQLRITKIDKNLAGDVVGMWVGVRHAEKPEYFVYYLIPSTDGDSGDDSDSNVPLLDVNSSKLVVGDLENKGNLRIELFNEYGSSKTDPSINPDDVAFNSKVVVTFTISGMSLNSDAAGSYDTSIYFADSDWYPSGNGTDVITVTGDGTYTVEYSGGAAAEGVMVFVIDIVGIYNDIADPSAVSVNVDKIELY